MTRPSTCRIAILARPGFLGDYVAEGIRRAGLLVSGPVDTADRLEVGDMLCQGAVLDIGLPARDLLLAIELLSARDVPIVLIGGLKEQPPVLVRGWPLLRQPFGSYQVVERLRAAGLAVPLRTLQV